MTEAQRLETLTCPKCRGDMRSYERSGVIVDQCTECRGIFLDRGEIDRLIAAEGARELVDTPSQAVPSPAAPSPAAPSPAAGATHNEPPPRDAPRDKQTQDRGRGGLFGNVMDIFGGGE